MRDSKVADRVALPATHDWRGAGHQVHQWAHASQSAVAKTAVSPVVPKVVASNAAVSMVHRPGATTIASVLQVRRKVAGTNASATHVDPNTVDLNVSVSAVRAVVNSNANDLQVHHAGAATIGTASPVGPIAGAKNVTDMHGVQKKDDMSAIALPVLRVHTEWIAIAWKDHHATTAMIKIVWPARLIGATSMARGPTTRLVRHSMRV